MPRKARRASTSPIPYWDERVVFMWNAKDSGLGFRTSATHLRFAVTKQDKIDLLTTRKRKVYLAWPGEKQTHVFVIDKPELALRSLRDGKIYVDSLTEAMDEIKQTVLEEATWK